MRPVAAQVRVELSFGQKDYLLYSAIEAKVKVTNGTGQPLDLARMSKGQAWIDFLIFQSDDLQVEHTNKAWNPPSMVLLPGEVKSMTINLLPYFHIRETGLYRVNACVRLAGKEFVSRTARFAVSHGTLLWADRYTAPPRMGDKEHKPRPRLYELIRHRNGEKDELFVRVSDPEAIWVYGTIPMGPLIRDSEPSSRIDREGNLHVFFQAGSRIFHYCRVSAEARRLGIRYFSNVSGPPTLITDDKGDTEVIGGEEIFPDSQGQPSMIPTAPMTRTPEE